MIVCENPNQQPKQTVEEKKDNNKERIEFIAENKQIDKQLLFNRFVILFYICVIL
jgi:hypothetical protein